MSTLNDTDLFVVERNGTQYQVRSDEVSTLNDTDLFVVERDGVQYKVEAQDVDTGPTGYFDTPVEVLTPLNGAGLNAGESYQPFSTAITGESGGVITFTDDTELENIIGPVRMVDANGAVKTPVSSAITNVSGSTLTFTDSTDLEFLKAGDTVAGPASAPVTADVFSTTLYTGSGPADKVVTTNIDNTAKTLVWTKGQNDSSVHALFDTVRGVGEYVATSANSGEQSDANSLKAFSSTGFTLGSATSMNSGGKAFVSWNFRAAPGFMDIVRWTASGGSSDVVVPHGLGVEPAFIITKALDKSENFYCYHKELDNANSNYMWLNNTEANYGNSGRNLWNPTANNFTSAGYIHSNSDYIGYVFASDNVNIKCGKYTAGSSSTFVNTSFQPGWVLIKCTNEASTNWVMFDTARGDYKKLSANTNDSEANLPSTVTLDSTGFTVDTNNRDFNKSGNTYIYIAIAENANTNVSPLQAFGDVVTSNPSGPTLELSNVSGTWNNGDIATGPVLNTVSNNVTAQSGNTLTVSDTTGDWRAGLYAEGATITRAGPTPDSIVFTSMNNFTTPVTGLDATLARRVWTLESSNSASGPWTLVGEYSDNAANASQDGATPWGNPTLSANTFYQVKVKYEGLNAEPVESLYNTFRTGDA